MPQVMDASDIARVTRRIAHEILEAHPNRDDLTLVGIHTRGVDLAQSLAGAIDELSGTTPPVGELDIGLYRDDKDIRPDTTAKTTVIPVDITNKTVVLVDDVLFTGRTVRAAMDALVDLGRADSTELAVLVDRGHRELPIKADYVGKNLPTGRDEIVRVKVDPVDGSDGVWIEKVAVA